MNELEKVGFATFVNNGDGWERVPNAKFMMKDENGNEIEMTPNEVIRQLMQDNKSLEHYINNLQSKIDKAIEYIEKDTRWFDYEYASVYGELCDCEGYNANRLEVMVNPSNLLKFLKGDK